MPWLKLMLWRRGINKKKNTGLPFHSFPFTHSLIPSKVCTSKLTGEMNPVLDCTLYTT